MSGPERTPLLAFWAPRPPVPRRWPWPQAGAWVFSFLLFAPATAPIEMTVDPRPGKFFGATLEGFAPDARGGDFRCSVALNGSAARMPFVGRAERIGQRLRLSATLRYADVPADWLNRFRSDTFDYRVEGIAGDSGSISWSGTLRWNQVSVAGDARKLSSFVRLTSLELTALTARRSQGRAVLALTNPFSFPVTLQEASCRLAISGDEVGSGSAQGRALRAQKTSALELPFEVDPARFLAAAGKAWSVGGPLDAEVSASLTLRLPSGELKIPFTLQGRMGTDGARSGVFSLPEGATSLSPH